jgi:hypothetical protein
MSACRGQIVRTVHERCLTPMKHNAPPTFQQCTPQMKNTSQVLDFFPFEVYGREEFFRVLWK